MKKIIAIAAIAGTLATASFAAGPNKELSKPVVALMPVIMQNADALALTPEQKAEMQAWRSTMPAKRKEIEDKSIALRAQLREAILAGAPTEERQAIADQIGATETQLVMMRSNCVDHWRAVLTEEQFAKVLELAAAK